MGVLRSNVDVYDTINFTLIYPDLIHIWHKIIDMLIFWYLIFLYLYTPIAVHCECWSVVC